MFKYFLSTFFLMIFILNCGGSKTMETPFKYGYYYQPNEITFLLPVDNADSVILHIYDIPKGGNSENYHLIRKKADLWGICIPFDLKGKFYTFSVLRNGVPSREFIDPWSRSNTNTYGRGLIFSDDTKIAKSPKLRNKTDAIIYEMHIRDFTIDSHSGIKQKGKFLGITEVGTKLDIDSTIKTGIDHLLDLGVNVVQVMPVQDFDNDEENPTYNWGYMPVNFNSPEGIYATDLTDDSRVVEFKKMVDALHKAGIRVNMDVVYNHTAENLNHNPWGFEILQPGKYYRFDSRGSYSNGSGCGNEFHSESKLGRDFIIESCKYWVSEYGIDGFRFDLMGLIDRTTMKDLVIEIKKIKPDIQVYGEPWTAGKTPIKPTIKGVQKGQGYAVFNDNYRDAIKGSVFDHGPGYVQAGINIAKIKKGILGSITDFAKNPNETINYVACHDNQTFWDRLNISLPKESLDKLIKMDKMGAALVFTAQGVPFIHSGQEFLRTKYGNDNSYNAPDSINMIRWEFKKKYLDVFNYYKGLIALRKAHPLFCFDQAEEIKKNIRFFDDDLNIPLPESVVAWQITSGQSGDVWQQAVLIANPTEKEFLISLPPGNFRLFGNEKQAGVKPLSEVVIHKEIKVKALEFLILAEAK